MNAIISSTIPTGLSLQRQLLKEELYRTRGELRKARAHIDDEARRKNGEIRQAEQSISHYRNENQRLKDTVNGLQNELNNLNVRQQLEDAKTLSEVQWGDAQIFLAKADTLSISEVGEKVTALNSGIFQVAAALGEALIHKRYELTLDAAVAESQETFGEKLTNILTQKPEPEVNPLLVQAVLQILMVKFCVSKIKSWYPSDSEIGRASCRERVFLSV